jgi:hypothetical protein
MQEIEKYGLRPLTEEQQAAVNGGDGVSDSIARGAGAIVGSVWWLLKVGGSALDLEYMHL